MTDEPLMAVTPEILDLDTLMHPLDLQSLQTSCKLLTCLLHSDSDHTPDQGPVTVNQPWCSLLSSEHYRRVKCIRTMEMCTSVVCCDFQDFILDQAMRVLFYRNWYCVKIDSVIVYVHGTAFYFQKWKVISLFFLPTFLFFL